MPSITRPSITACFWVPERDSNNCGACATRLPGVEAAQAASSSATPATALRTSFLEIFFTIFQGWEEGTALDFRLHMPKTLLN